MLLEFKAKNYKTFKDKFCFSMTPDSELDELQYSVLSEPSSPGQYKALSTSVIYGANASGKTNIISAMHSFKDIVLKGGVCEEKSVNRIFYDVCKC